MKSNSQSRLAAVYLDNDVVLSKSHAWTYVKIPLVPYEFLSSGSREFLCGQIAMSLGALISSSKETVDVHLRVAHKPFDTLSWGKNLNERVLRQQPAPGWNNYLLNMMSHVEALSFTEKQVFLGVCLGQRNEGSKGGEFNPIAEIINPFKKLVSGLEKAAGYEDDVVSEKELDGWKKKSRDVRRILLGSNLKAVPATANEIAWLIANPMWPEMEQPPVSASENSHWGPGEIRHITEGAITHHRKWLEVEQVSIDRTVEKGYTASLAISRFPDILYFPEQEPWMHFPSVLPFPVGFSSRFTIVPPMQVQKDVGKKLADAKDSAQHIAEAGTAVPLKVREQLETATMLEYTIDKDRQPWAYARHRILVHGATEEELTDRCRTIIEMYQDLGIDVAWPTGDQFDLFCESMPGDRVRGRSYYQRQELSVIAGGMATASSDCGDRIEKGKGWLGPYIGYTTSRVANPVMYSPNVAMTRNSPPGVAIVGAPGGGKSFLAFTLAYQMALQGVWTIYIDPKADAKPMGELEELGNARVFDLRDGNDGMLDPFSLGASKSEATLLAVETLRLLLGGSVSEEREEALLNAVERVSQEPQPSLSRVVDLLLANEQSSASRNLGAVLRTIRDLPFARLCFAPTGGMQLRPEDGLTVVTLLGLDLPTASTAPSDYSYENRLAVSVMYLLTRYSRRLMLNMNKDHPKAICIDEAWAITSTPQGAKLIPEIARMGRSHNCALVLVSQNAGDLMAESVTNSLSTKFAFRSTIPGEIENVLELFGLEKDQEEQGTIRQLRNGECVMQDMDGRLARVQIDAWNQSLFDTFNTNPETRGKPGST